MGKETLAGVIIFILMLTIMSWVNNRSRKKAITKPIENEFQIDERLRKRVLSYLPHLLNFEIHFNYNCNHIPYEKVHEVMSDIGYKHNLRFGTVREDGYTMLFLINPGDEDGIVLAIRSCYGYGFDLYFRDRTSAYSEYSTNLKEIADIKSVRSIIDIENRLLRKVLYDLYTRLQKQA
jgi:hypothetical protein